MNLEDGWLQVRQGLQRIDGQLVTAPIKTARSRRMTPLPQLLVQVLERHRDQQERSG